MSRLISCTLAVASLLALPAVTHAQAVEPGDEWKMNISMEMEGMKLPAQSTTQCMARSQPTVVPEAQDKNCKTTIVSQTGNTVEMKMACTGKNAMQGTGKFTTTGTSMTGQMKMSSADGSMTMNYAGTKTGKACDAKAMERQVNAMVAQGAAATDKLCSDAARDLSPEFMFGKSAICPDAKYRTAFCANVKGEAAYSKLHQYETGRRQGMPGEPLIPLVEGACGVNMATMGQQLCSGAEGRKSWTFLAENCPVQAQTIAKRECAGRSFTARAANPSPYDAFCSTYAAGSNSGDDMPAKAADKPADKPETASDKVKSGAKKLKGLLNF